MPLRGRAAFIRRGVFYIIALKVFILNSENIIETRLAGAAGRVRADSAGDLL